MNTESPRRKPWLLLAVTLLVALLAAACGGDDSEGGTANPDGPETTEDPGTPVAGGEATILLYSEIGSLNPATFTGSGGAEGMRAFAAYGALAGMQQILPVVLAIAAASLLYVAVADLIPSLHRRSEPVETAKQMLWIVLGIAIIAVTHQLL